MLLLTSIGPRRSLVLGEVTPSSPNDVQLNTHEHAERDAAELDLARSTCALRHAKLKEAKLKAHAADAALLAELNMANALIAAAETRDAVRAAHHS